MIKVEFSKDLVEAMKKKFDMTKNGVEKLKNKIKDTIIKEELKIKKNK